MQDWEGTKRTKENKVAKQRVPGLRNERQPIEMLCPGHVGNMLPGSFWENVHTLIYPLQSMRTLLLCFYTLEKNCQILLMNLASPFSRLY